jgi:hypothetical protein
VECDDDEDQQDREGGGDKVEEEDIGHDVGGPLSSPPGVCARKENKQNCFFFLPPFFISWGRSIPSDDATKNNEPINPSFLFCISSHQSISPSWNWNSKTTIWYI